MILVAVCVFVVMAAIKLVVLAALFAVLIGGTFLPVVDWLARHHVKRWIAAFLVVIFLILLAVGICLVVLYGLVNQWPEIQDNLQKAWDSIQKSLNSTSVSKEQMDSAKANLQNALKAAASGATSAIGDLIGGVAGLIFGVFISINILVWVLIQGREIGGWASRHMPPVPQPVAYAMLANSARFFRGYIYGSTIVGVFNGAVIFVGALIIGVPLAATLGLVAWMTNYIPYFGAIISGAFAVLVAWGAGGPSMGIPMLIIVIIANGFLQTLVSQFALGSALNLHPLSVLFATTAGGILFGAVGGVFAAPFLKIGLDSYGLMKDAGLFGARAAQDADDAGAGPPGTQARPALLPASTRFPLRPEPAVAGGSAPSDRRLAGDLLAERGRRVLDGLREDAARIGRPDVRAVVERVLEPVEGRDVRVVQQVEAVGAPQALEVGLELLFLGVPPDRPERAERRRVVRHDHQHRLHVVQVEELERALEELARPRLVVGGGRRRARDHRGEVPLQRALEGDAALETRVVPVAHQTAARGELRVRRQLTTLGAHRHPALLVEEVRGQELAEARLRQQTRVER